MDEQSSEDTPHRTTKAIQKKQKKRKENKY
jgi:hypothetical protein